MDNSKLITLLNERKVYLNNILDLTNEKINISNKFDFLIVNDFSRIKDCDLRFLLGTYFYMIMVKMVDENSSFTSALEIADEFIEAFKDVPHDKLDKFLSLKKIADYGLSSKMTKCVKNDFYSAKAILTIFANDEEVNLKNNSLIFSSALKSLKSISKKHSLDKFFKLCEDSESKNLFLIFSIYKFYFDVLSNKKLYDEMVEEINKFNSSILPFKIKKHEIVSFENIPQKEIPTFENFIIDKCYGADTALFAIQSIVKFFNNINNWKSIVRDCNKEISSIDSILDKLVNIDYSEITNASELVKNIRDEDLKREVLMFIYNFNKKYYLELIDKYNTLSNDDDTLYKSLFIENGINISNIDISCVKNYGLDDLKFILSFFKKIFNDDSKMIIFILSNSSLNKILYIYDLFAKGYLNVKLLKEHYDMFFEDSNSLGIYQNNIECILGYELNPLIFSEDFASLLIDSVLFNKNLGILKQYDLLNNLKDSSNFKLLSVLDLDVRIDKFIELGFYDFLKEDLSILSNNNLKRLDVLYSMNLPVTSKDELFSLLKSNDFLVNDCDIDSYIFNVLDYKESCNFEISFENLVNFKKNNFEYLINGVIISVEKVSRLLESGSNLYDAIFSNMVLSEDDYERVICSLKDYKLKKD